MMFLKAAIAMLLSLSCQTDVLCLNDVIFVGYKLLSDYVTDIDFVSIMMSIRSFLYHRNRNFDDVL